MRCNKCNKETLFRNYLCYDCYIDKILNTKPEEKIISVNGLGSYDFKTLISLIKRSNLEQLYFIKDSAINEEIIKRKGQKY